MAHGWNPYFHNFSSLPSDHGTPDSEVSHHHPADDFTNHSGFSSASGSHGASASNTNYCFSNSIGNNNSNWSSEIGTSQRNYREMAWQPDGEQKAYLPRWDNSVSDFEANVLGTAGNCSIAPQLGLKQDTLVPKGPQYFQNYLNIQGSSDQVSEPRSTCDFISSTSEHNPQTGATARYHSQWLQRSTENANMSADRTYSSIWPNPRVENVTKCVQDRSKSFEHDGNLFANSNTYPDSETQGTGHFDQTSKQTFVNICQNANLSHNYNGIDAQTMMDAKDTSETNKGKNLDSHKAYTENQAPNTQTLSPQKDSLFSDSCQNDKDDGPSQSSSQSSVTNDLTNSDVSLTDDSEASNDSQSSFQANVTADDEQVIETADCISHSQSSPPASDACSVSDGNLTETVNEKQAAPSKVDVATFSTLSGCDPSTYSDGDLKDQSDTMTESSAVHNSGCNMPSIANNNSDPFDLASNATIHNKTNKNNPLDSVTNVTIDRTSERDPPYSAANTTADYKTNESDPLDSAASLSIDNKTNEKEPFHSTASITTDNKSNENDLHELAANASIDNKTNDGNPLDSASNMAIDNNTHKNDPLDLASNVTITKTNENDSRDSAADVTIDNKTNESNPLDSSSTITIDNKTNENDSHDSAVEVTIDNKTNDSNPPDSASNMATDNKTESDPLDPAANVVCNKSKGDNDIETVEIERPCPEEKLADSDHSVGSDFVTDGGHTLDSNMTMAVFDSEPTQVKDCLNKMQEKESITTCTTFNVTCDNPTNYKTIENAQDAILNIDIIGIEPQLLKTPEEKSSLEKEESPESPSDKTTSIKQVQHALENISSLESEISEGRSSACEISKATDEDFDWDDFGKPLTPSPSEIDERPESPEMQPSTEMIKKLQPIVLIKTSDLVHLISDKYVCAQCMHITSSVDELIEHHSIQHPGRSFQLCKSCGVYLVNQDQSRKHFCDQESTILSSNLVVKKKRQQKYCNKCRLHFLKWNAFISHMRTHTGVTPYKCEKCKLYFAQKSTLSRHKRIPGRCRGAQGLGKCAPKKSHNRSLKSMFSCYVKLFDITKTHFCKYCGKCFKSQVKANKHVYNVHKRPGTIAEQRGGISVVPDVWSEKKKYKCPLCPMVFHQFSKRNHHLKECVKENFISKKNRVGGRFKCPLCLASFSLASNRYRHLYTFCLRNFLSFLGKETSVPFKFPRYSKQMQTVISKLKAEEDQLNGVSSVNGTTAKPEPRFKCNVCPAVFPNKSAKYRHIKKHKALEVTGRRFKYSHSADKTSITLSTVTNTGIQKRDIDSVKCKYCEQSFGSAQALKKHEFTHQGERPFYCSQCGKGFKSHVVLTQHKVTHQRKIQCTVCRKILPTIRALIQHRTSHLNRGLLQCPDCPRQFPFPVYLIRHLRNHLKTQNKLLLEDETVKKLDPSSTLSAHNPCQLCSEVFDDAKLLTKHYMTHVPKSSSPQCPFCKRKFTERRNLLRHMANHVGGKPMSKKNNLNSQPETQSFVCRYCSRTFLHKSHLMKHYRGHKNKTLLQCATCNLYFGASKLSIHKKVCKSGATGLTSQTTDQLSVRTVSSGETKYQCQHCTQTFKYPSLYYRHLSTHKDVDDHACILCGQNFPSLVLCSQHEASCDGLYKCEESTESKKAKIVPQGSTSELKCKFCNKIFTKSRNFRRHILTHNEVKPYRCKACDSCFSRYDRMKVHLGCCKGKEKLQLRPQICIPKISLDLVGTGWQKEKAFRLEKVVKKQTLECKICARKFATQSKLRWHNSMFHTVKRFKCMQCSSFFSHEKSLRDHIRHRRCRVANIVRNSFSSEKTNVLLARILPPSKEKNASKTIKCNFCFRIFRTSAHLKVHMLLHCENSFACDCGKRFFQKTKLQRHITTCMKRNQSSPRGFSCAYCSSRFLLFSQLQEHFLNSHKLETKDEPIETAPLQQHLSSIQHFEENKFAISESSQASKLNGPFDAIDFQPAFQLKKSPYPCKICNKGYWNKTLLRNHFRKCRRKVSNTTQPPEEDVPLRADIDMVLTDSEAENSPEDFEDTELQNKASQDKKTAVYQCSECDKSFTDGLLLISHLEAHGREEQEKRLNKCSKCGRTFLNQARLEKHMKVHETGRFICKDCSTEFPSKTELESHRKKCHDPSNPYSCRLCHQRFRSRMLLCDHCTQNHPDDVFSCHFCNRNYTLRTSLIRHNRNCHAKELTEGTEKSLSTQSSSESEAAAGDANDGGDDDNDNNDDDDYNDDDDDDDGDSDSDSDSADSDSAPYFPCHVCAKTFTTSESLEDHQRCHLGEKPFECAQCGQCFFQAGQLQQHERKHKSEFQCRVCGRGFVSLFALRKHKHTSGKKRPFRCKKCPLYFTSHALLADHMLSHREESFPCDICNRVFPSKISRAEHRKIHLPKSSATELPAQPAQPAVKADNKPASLSAATNEFKYRCGVCCVRFRNPEELSEHGCLPGIERQYSCLDCDKHFLHSSHLKKHLSTHKQPSSQSKYTCNQCNNSFSSPLDFLSHLKNHDKTIRYGHGFVCPTCHQCFPSPAELAFHFPNHPSGMFQCKLCNKTFLTATQLKEHEVCHSKETKCKKCGQSIQGENHECSPRHIELMNIVSSFADDDEIDVTGEDLCFCPFCPMRFSSRSGLLEHQNREHPNEKSYTCEICAKTYPEQKYLDRHTKKRHKNDTTQSTSQLKFNCTECHSEFNTAKDLSVHLKLHAAEKEVGGEYRCDMCYKSFDQLHLLRQHQESHVGQVVYECTECDKAFAFPHLLEEHQKSHV